MTSFLRCAYLLCDGSSSGFAFSGVVCEQPLSEVLAEPVGQLLAEGDLRYEVQHVPAVSERVSRQLYVDFCLSGSCHSMQHDGLACFQGITCLEVGFVLCGGEGDVRFGLRRDRVLAVWLSCFVFRLHGLRLCLCTSQGRFGNTDLIGQSFDHRLELLPLLSSWSCILKCLGLLFKLSLQSCDFIAHGLEHPLVPLLCLM